MNGLRVPICFISIALMAIAHPSGQADENTGRAASQFSMEVQLDRPNNSDQKSVRSSRSMFSAVNQRGSGDACFVDAIADGDFELNNGSWTIVGSAFNPLCNPALCGPDLATSGEFYLWLGGGFFFAGNEGTATQTVVIPTNASTLMFDYVSASNANSGCESPSEDLLELLIDGEQVFRSPDPCSNFFPFELVTIDLAALGLNDGLEHEVEFHAVNVDDPVDPGSTLTNFFLDNVRLLSPASLDSDSDGVMDTVDNCTDVVNPDQRDTNGDGFGNVCDPDLDNDGIVNFLDIGIWTTFFNTEGSEDTDFDGDGFTNFRDFDILMQLFLQEPGPNFECPM